MATLATWGRLTGNGNSTPSFQASPLGMEYAIDRFAILGDAVLIGGWICPSGERGVEAVVLEVEGLGVFPLRLPDRASPDVAAQKGPKAHACRFEEVIVLGEAPTISDRKAALEGATLRVDFTDGECLQIGALTEPFPGETGGELFNQFREMLDDMDAGQVLEIGSRARSGNVHSGLIPERLKYVGLDIIDGPNVDVIGDAHNLTQYFSPASFRAVFAISVLEHILMPWKLVIEMNRIMAPGAIGFFGTHQGWPVHDAPWDFWRFSDTAWTGLLNEATGFEIIGSKMSERARVVADRWRPVLDFGGQPVFLSSVVLFRKTGPTRLEWPVELEQISRTLYPDE